MNSKTQGCLTCLCVIQYSDMVYNLNINLPGDDNTTLKIALADCLPELLLDTTDNGILCELCYKRVLLMYQFKQNCLEVQSKIYGYLQQVPINTKADIGEIALYYRRIDALAIDDAPSELETTINSISMENVCTKNTGPINTFVNCNTSSVITTRISSNSVLPTNVTSKVNNVKNIPNTIYTCPQSVMKKRRRKRKSRGKFKVKVQIANNIISHVSLKHALELGIWDETANCLKPNYKLPDHFVTQMLSKNVM